MEWRTLWGRTDGIFTPGAVIGLYHLSQGEVVLIDSGAERDPEMLAALAARGLRVRAVVCTHLHPDHVANNPALVERDGAEIFAGAEEIGVVSSMERYCEEYGLSDMTEAERDRAWRFGYPFTAVTEDVRQLEIDGAVFDLIHTPGHSRSHMAVATPDGVCCVGDALLSHHILRYAKMPYMLEINRALHAMERLRETCYPLYMLSHNGVVKRDGLSQLVDDNIEKELELYRLLLEQLDRPMELDALAAKLLVAAGVVNPESMRPDVMLQTARARVYGLLQTGECRMEGGLVIKA